MMLPIRRQRGIALMLVMWVLTLLTVMAVSLTVSRRTEIALTDNHVESARFRALAEAAIAYTALHYMTPEAQLDAEQDTAWLPNGQPRTWSFAGSELSLRVFNESSRYSLNQIQPDTLRALLEVLGLVPEDADALAAAIIDWRDEDDLALLNGAEDSDYEQAGRALGAKDAPYEAVEELRQVLGMTPEIYRLLAPEVSVESGSAQPDERFASPAVLATLKGLTLEDAREEIIARDQAEVPGATTTTVVNRGGPLYRLQITEPRSRGAGRSMEVLFQLAPGQQPPYQVLWRRDRAGFDTSLHISDPDSLDNVSTPADT
ncbi:general secretion pathway protein GspK [Allochromatium palmeri]|uniref:General secretion pathway protein GspK n=1 Tax=Allochromatium palmeri TaxID=231048 RepID=A0A6N8EDR9_9GAMM|nr:type II secretion system protein GspK [Allochromatium palmeri]MTW22375.1 general secretion pathway protein GspK [Allochromatium palmeri]